MGHRPYHLLEQPWAAEQQCVPKLPRTRSTNETKVLNMFLGIIHVMKWILIFYSKCEKKKERKYYKGGHCVKKLQHCRQSKAT